MITLDAGRRCVCSGGGAGSIGTAALAMVRRAGAGVLSSARPTDRNGCRAAGADVVVEYQIPAWATSFATQCLTAWTSSGTPRASAAQLVDAARLVNDMLSAGEPSARVTEILPHSATPEAHACLEAEQVRGRVLLRP